MESISFMHQGVHYIADTSRAIDLSIAIDFDDSRFHVFGAPAAQSTTLSSGTFVGDVNRGGSCNCSTYSLTPHCNGTHTECVGHITRDAMSVHAVAPTSLLFAALISVEPITTATAFAGNDKVITASLLQSRLNSRDHYDAVIVRTQPNRSKKNLIFDEANTPYFSEEALVWLASINVAHLLCDLPSVDRMNDNGLLLAHRAFWGVPPGSSELSQATRSHATITELIHVPDDVSDGNYLLNLQVAPLNADASPSRPLLFPLLDKDEAR